MDIYFKVLLENQCADAAKNYLIATDYVDGGMSNTERGKRKDKEKWEPKKEEYRKHLITLLKLNYPEFKDRIHNVNYYKTRESVYVSINRTEPEPATPQNGEDMWQG
jgi:hypothetical protein